MSTPLQVQDLSSLAAGGTGTLDLTPAAPTANPAFTNQQATLAIYNESGAGLRFNGKDTGVGFDLPAGGWKDVPIPVGETSLTYTALYVLAGALVNKLIATLYAPNEAVGVGATVGNSPVNGGSLSQATSVIQTGQAAGSAVLQATPNSSFIGATQESLIENDGTAFFGNTNALAHNNITFDNVGNLFASGLSSKAPVTLFTGNQETGHYFTQFVAPSAVAWDFWVPFKDVMTNVPSSITLSGTTTVNCTATTGGITKYGFRLILTPTGAGTTSCDTDWVTVGN